MLIWSFTFFCLFYGCNWTFRKMSLSQCLGRIFASVRHEVRALERVEQALSRFQERIEAGLIPDERHWSEIRSLPAPWGNLTYESLLELRERGGSVLPTLKRIRKLAVSHIEMIHEARARSSQALAQALFCGLLVPGFGVVLFIFLEPVSEMPMKWIFACTVSFALTSLGGLWILRMTEKARWGGLQASERNWLLQTQILGERFLALIGSGSPPDLAWQAAVRFISEGDPELVCHWGAELWSPADSKPVKRLADSLINLGMGLRKAVQVSLMEGVACSGKVESALEGLSIEIRSFVQREVQLLSTRALKPLYLCVAPALFYLLGFAIYLSSAEVLNM